MRAFAARHFGAMARSVHLRYAENGSLVEVRLVPKPVSAEASAGGTP